MNVVQKITKTICVCWTAISLYNPVSLKVYLLSIDQEHIQKCRFSSTGCSSAILVWCDGSLKKTYLESELISPLCFVMVSCYEGTLAFTELWVYRLWRTQCNLRGGICLLAKARSCGRRGRFCCWLPVAASLTSSEWHTLAVPEVLFSVKQQFYVLVLLFFFPYTHTNFGCETQHKTQ